MSTTHRQAHTETSMMTLLERRYRGEKSGNGLAWAFIPKVRNAAGFDATRTMDALAIGLWPSRGLELHGHEIKISRSDWLRELKDPAKAEVFVRLVDKWWVVASDASIVQDGELPPAWGLMVANGRGLKIKTQAAELPATDAPWMPRTFLAALLRSACRTSEVQPEEIAAAVAQARSEWDAHHADNIEQWRKERDGLRNRINAFEREAEVRLGGPYGHEPEKVGAALRLVLSGQADTERFTRRYEQLADSAERLATDLRRAVGLGDLGVDGQ